MRATFHPLLERCRIDGEPGSGACGAFRCPGPEGKTLLVVASDGRDWDEAGLDGEAWEHVSVSTHRRCPTWKEMSWVRDLFWGPEECVMELHVPRGEHLNHHPHCLHLWKPTVTQIPRPPAITVAFATEDTAKVEP